jgi:7-carboxy-7-deazaguanine synthase
MIAEQRTYNPFKEAIHSEPERIGQKLLPVMEAFYTLQGEGFYQGKAAYFIRLGGCDVGCFWCDVKESWDASVHSQKTVTQIIEAAKQAINHQPPAANPVFVITGGEPLMHNLDELTLALKKENFKTHIETSGSSSLSGYWDWICLSPKKFKKPLPEVFLAANELKVVIYNKSDFNWAEENAARVSTSCKLYLQPEWSKANVMTPPIINYIKANPQWQLSLQVHKYLDIP